MDKTLRCKPARLRARNWPIFGLTLAGLMGVALAPGVAGAAGVLPTGGQVIAGSATIAAPNTSGLTIKQSSSRAIIDWSGFSIGKGETVQFDNGAGATLNRVIGFAASDVSGLLKGSGSVYLINPHGIIIGKSGVVDVGGTFAAATLDLNNAQFLTGGSLTFSGNSTAAVINYGKIGSLGGDVALIAATVQNQGSLSAGQGDAGLLAGYEVVLRDQALNDGKFAVVIGGAPTSATNAGLIQAADAELRANGGNIYALAGNTQSVIKATGVRGGDGKVFLVAEGGNLSLGGTIQARGAGGAGGAIETSASNVVIGKAGIDAGRGGQWLLDPDDLTIDQTAANTIASSLNAGTSVTQQTTASGTGGNGDIFVASNVAIDWTTNASLTLSAFRNISLGDGSSIVSTGGGAVTLYADNTGTGTGTVSFGAGAGVSTSGAVNIFYNPSVNPAGSVVNATSYVGPTENFAANIAGGATLTAYMLVNTVADLQNVQNNLAGSYALGANIDAGATSGWNAGAGFSPIGGPATPFSGQLNGQGHAIAGLVINEPSTGDVGLFGDISQTAVIQSMGLVGGSVSGNQQVGDLVGYDAGAYIVDAYASGSVTGVGDVGGLVGDEVGGWLNNVHATGSVVGQGEVGGLVGTASGAITNAYANSLVRGQIAVGGIAGYLDAATIYFSNSAGSVSGDSDVGGLAGINTGYLKTSYSTSSVSGATNIGGLAGSNTPTTVEQEYYYACGFDTCHTYYAEQVGGSISRSYATGAVSAITGIGGGLVGSQSGGSISQSFATGAVTGGVTLGGLVGGNDGGSIIQSYASGPVTATGQTVGGLVGYENYGGTIYESYSTSAVTGTDYVGGLVGAWSGNGVAGGINQSYATGAVSSPGGNVGGLMGYNSGAAINASYWDSQTTGQTSSSGGGTPLTTAQFLTGSNLAGFNFGTAAGQDGWVLIDADGSLNNAGGAAGATRPMLLSEWSANIVNLHQLQLMELIPSNNYDLGANIDASPTSGANPSDLWSSAGFVPIGNGSITYTGVFDGQGHTISGLVINQSSASDVGLFGAIGQTATIQNVGLVGGSVSGNQQVGDLVGYDFGGAVVNAYATGSVTGVGGVGGLVGYEVGGWINNAHATGNVVGQDGVGGLVGTESGAITNAYATGTVSASYDVAGGLVGEELGPITNSYATGAVSGGPYLGGLVGYDISSSISNSYATGSVTGPSTGLALVGGLVGDINNGQISNSYATGAVSGFNTAGGLVGEADATNIDHSYATGAVAGGENLGGLVGDAYYGTISQSFASGNVSGNSEYVGGLVGFYAYGTISDSYATGSALGFDYVGGLVGNLYEGFVAQTYATGWTHAIGAASYVSGLVGNEFNASVTNSVWDAGTSGQQGPNVSGAGVTTATLQSGLPSGFSSALWGIVPGESYPYLAWQFTSGSPQVISGSVAGEAGVSVTAYVGGAAIPSVLTGGTVTTGANGYYYYLFSPGTLPTVLPLAGATVASTAAGPVTGLSFLGGVAEADGSILGLNITDGQISARTSESSYASLQGDLSSTFGAATYANLSATLGGAPLFIAADGAFIIDQGMSRAGSIQIESGGDLTIASTGSVASPASSDAVILAANGNFINNAGASAVSAPNGVWLIYSQTSGGAGALPTGDVFGGLSAKSYYGDPFTFGNGAPGAFASAPNAGDRFVYGDQPTLTVTATTQSDVYDGAVQSDSYSVTGLQNGDAPTDAVQGALFTSSKNVGAYAFLSGAGFSSDENYAISFVPGTLTITPAALSVSLTGTVEKTYDGNTSATLAAANYTLAGVYGTDSVVLNDPSSGTYDTKNAGYGKIVSVSGLAISGTDSEDYTVNTASSGAVGTIDPKALTVSLIGSTTKVYDGTLNATLTAANYTLPSGIIAGDQVAANDPSTGTYSDKNVGSQKLITVTNVILSGADAGNYSVGPVSGAIGVITPKTVSVAFNGLVEKTYDGTTTASLNATDTRIVGEIAGDSVTATGVASYASKNVGTNLQVNATTLGLTGADAADYSLGAQQTLGGKVGKIDPKLLTAALTGVVEKVYNRSTTAALAASNYGLSGVVAGDSVELNDPRSGLYASRDVGIGLLVTVTGLKLSGTAAANYTLGGVTTVSGDVGKIDPKLLTASLVGSVIKHFDGTANATLNAANYRLTGVFAGDVVALNDPTLGFYNSGAVGTKKLVTVNGVALIGSTAQDYALSTSVLSAAIGTILP